jgi:hypothetical protein
MSMTQYVVPHISTLFGILRHDKYFEKAVHHRHGSNAHGLCS